MQELSLEKEFEIYKLIHKITILEAKLTTYYRTIQETGIKIPFFMLESPERKANKEIEQLLDTDRDVFEALYQKAWDEYAECLP